MAKFCTKCGRPLQEGEVCNCSNQAQNMGQAPMQNMGQAPMQNMGQAPMQNGQAPMYNGAPNMNTANMNQPNAGNQFVSDTKTLFTTFFKNPIQGGRAFIKNPNIALVAVLIALQGICTGLFGYLLASKLMGKIDDAFSLLSSFISIPLDFKVPFASAFFTTFLLSMVYSVILAGLLFAAYKIVKLEIGFKNVLAQVALRSIFTICLTVLAMLFAFINPIVAAYIFSASSLAGIILICLTLPEGNRSCLLYYMLFIAFFLFAIISAFIMTKAYVSYIPSSIKNLGSKASSYSNLFNSYY